MSERLVADDRGQAVWVGFILLVTLLLLVLAGYQTVSVPNQNAETEFEHSQQLQGDMIDLSNALVDVQTSAEAAQTQRPVQLRLGTSYRTRVLTINPPPPTGRLRTVDRGPIEFDGASAVGAFEGDPQGTLLDPSHDTRLVTYTPSYNEYGGAPTQTSFEHSLVYEQYDAAALSVRDQRTIRGGTNRLNLILYEGEIDRQDQRVTVDPETLDGPTPPVPIEADSGDTFEMTLPTDAPDLWASEDVIGETFDQGEQDARVTATSASTVTVELRGQWDLQMARVGLDGGTAGTAFSDVDRVADEPEAANRTYRTRWDRDAIANDPDVAYDDEIDTLLIDEDVGTVEGVVQVTERATGDPIESATVDLGTTQSDVISVQEAPAVTEEFGEATVDLTVENEGTTRLFAASGDDVDGVDASVVAEEDDGSAGAASYVPGTLQFQGNGNRLAFDVTFDDPVTISSASIDTRTMPGGARENLGLLEIDGDDQEPPDYTSDGSPISFTETPVSDTVTIEFGQFQSQGGQRLPGDPADYTFVTTEPAGDHIAISLTFEDGTTYQIYFAYTP